MLTKQQKSWINHLSDSPIVKIVPYDLKVKEVFAKQREEIRQVLGEEVEVLLLGASTLEIPGKGDVDIFIPVDESEFEGSLEKLEGVFGSPGSRDVQESMK